jgi:phosphomevalonate kinase
VGCHSYAAHLRRASYNLRPNPFVETALSYALTYVATLKASIIEPATITILADNDYYSQPPQRMADGSSSKAGFASFGVHLWEAHKTGLGSSAALVTSFIAAVLTHYLPDSSFSLATDYGRTCLHNLAQAAHCAAQGKVGSGFDIASAVFGSCLYRRFSPALLELGTGPGSPGFAEKLQALVEDTNAQSKWDTEILKSAVDIPPGLRLVMCDVDCGSETPGMVKKVLAWRKENPEEADRIWNALQKGNEALAAELVKLSKTPSKDYSLLKQQIIDNRVLIREMSKASGVPVEPMQQTQLLDACSAVPGVIGGVVPGAGGYDAVALLIEDQPEVEARLTEFLAGYQVQVEQPDGQPSIGKAKLLRVSGEMEGARKEDIQRYHDWLT